MCFPVTIGGNTTFTGSGGFLCRNFIYNSPSSAQRTVTLQAGNTYVITDSLLIGNTINGNQQTGNPNLVQSGSGAAGLARPKLILRHELLAYLVQDIVI